MEFNYSLEKVIEDNSKLIYKIASKYQNYFDKEDLYQVGVIGIINAYNNFNPNMNVKFSSYAFTYIVGEINKFVRENKNIKISRDLIRLGTKINEYIEKHFKVRGYKPSITDIANMLGTKENKIIDALNATNVIKSLDEKINDDGKEITLLDITKEEEKTSKDDLLDLKNAFKYLNNKEKSILIDRYYNNYTQSEIANSIGVNQVYVSRIEKKALTKMKTLMK